MDRSDLIVNERSLIEKAMKVFIDKGHISHALLQKELSLRYMSAAMIIDEILNKDYAENDDEIYKKIKVLVDNYKRI